MTPFCFEHVFRARSTDEVVAAYFDADHQVEQDRRVDIASREVLEIDETDGVVRRTCRVVPRRKLPALVKPLIPGELDYVETVTWRRGEDALEIAIRPSMLRGRVQITGTYRLDAISDGEIRRRYEGAVSVDIAFLAGRIERGIVAELARTLPLAAACTQDWLDRS